MVLDSDYDTCLWAGTCVQKILRKQLAGCVVKPGKLDTCIELTSKDCDDMHLIQHGTKEVKVCAGAKEFDTLCHAMSSHNQELALVTAVVARTETCPSEIPYTSRIIARYLRLG